MERALEEWKKKVEQLLECWRLGAARTHHDQSTGTPPSRIIVATFLAGGARRTSPTRQECIVDDAQDVWELISQRRHVSSVLG